MSLIVSNDLVVKNDGYGRSINQLIDIFVKPELEKRNKKDFKSAVIEMFDGDRKPIVHFEDDNIQFVIEFNKPKVDKDSVGKTLSVDLKEIKKIDIYDDKLDPNSAKAFIIKWGKEKVDYWILGFDFRYNKKIAKEKIVLAKEFLDATKKINVSEQYTAAIILLWQAFDLILDVHLWMMPNSRPKNHKDKQKKLEMIKQNLPDYFYKNYKQLYLFRNEAVHGQGKRIPVKKDEISDLVNKLEKLLVTDSYFKF